VGLGMRDTLVCAGVLDLCLVVLACACVVVSVFRGACVMIVSVCPLGLAMGSPTDWRFHDQSVTITVRITAPRSESTSEVAVSSPLRTQVVTSAVGEIGGSSGQVRNLGEEDHARLLSRTHHPTDAGFRVYAALPSLVAGVRLELH